MTIISYQKETKTGRPNRKEAMDAVFMAYINLKHITNELSNIFERENNYRAKKFIKKYRDIHKKRNKKSPTGDFFTYQTYHCGGTQQVLCGLGMHAWPPRASNHPILLCHAQLSIQNRSPHQRT